MIYLEGPQAPVSLQDDKITKRVHYVYRKGRVVVIPVVTELGTPSAKHAPDRRDRPRICASESDVCTCPVVFY